jgi:YD repeat-containing protein
MRVVAITLLVLGSQASAEPLLRHEDAELVRTDLRSMTARKYEAKLGKLVEAGREVRTYDAAGRVSRDEHLKADGSMVVVYDYVWDAQGRLAKRTYRDDTKRTEARTFAYKVDANGRIVERIMRDPAAPAGEYFRDEYLWQAAAHSVTTYRHSAQGGPYRSDVATYDAMDRMVRSCAEHGGCSMYEYDSHGGLSRVREQGSDGEHFYRDYASTYDAAGRLTARTVGGTASQFKWNTRGDVSDVIDSRIPAQGGALEAKTIYTYVYR